MQLPYLRIKQSEQKKEQYSDVSEFFNSETVIFVLPFFNHEIIVIKQIGLPQEIRLFYKKNCQIETKRERER